MATKTPRTKSAPRKKKGSAVRVDLAGRNVQLQVAASQFVLAKDAIDEGGLSGTIWTRKITEKDMAYHDMRLLVLFPDNECAMCDEGTCPGLIGQ